MKVKIIGAGSIGNHFAHAARSVGWEVLLCDRDAEALNRARKLIYPSRYGAWDASIETHVGPDSPTGDFDLIIVGTPPDSHIGLARKALAEMPRAILVEKPLTGPDLTEALNFKKEVSVSDTQVFVGYNHLLSPAVVALVDYLRADTFGEILTLETEFREHWEGIFAAHPWLTGPQESYLGFSSRGGGALGEHSHGISLWLHLAEAAGLLPLHSVSASLDIAEGEDFRYDRVGLLNLETQCGKSGRVMQDVVARPTRKSAYVQGEFGSARLSIGEPAGADSLVVFSKGSEAREEIYPKSRPEEFVRELGHIFKVLDGTERNDVISLNHGWQTAEVISAAFRSDSSGTKVIFGP